MTTDDDLATLPQIYRNVLKVHFDSFIKKSTKPTGLPLKKPCYHYTNAQGLYGILESKSIWLTDIDHMNDPSELKHGLSFAIDYLESLIQAVQNKYERVFFTVIRTVLTEHISYRYMFYVASFSFDADHLNQWRAYADNGRGYCIEVSKDVFQRQNLNTSKLKPLSVTVMQYGDSKIKTRQRKVIKDSLQVLKSTPSPENLSSDQLTAFMKKLAATCVTNLIVNSIDFKNIAYKTEKEVRLLLIHGSAKARQGANIRVTDGTFVPYHTFNLTAGKVGNNFLNSITVGPAARADAELALHKLLRSLNYSGISIRRSKIPYRGN